jgi:hypothetical protein
LIGKNIFETDTKLWPDESKWVLDPRLAMVAKVAFAAKTLYFKV